MLLGLFSSLFNKNDTQPYISVDIGTSAIKVMSLDVSGAKPKLLSAGSAPTPANCITNNAISRPDQVGAAIRSVIEANEIAGTRATIALPGPSVFTKKITLARQSLKDLDANIRFEASNYIPHSIDAVHLDYQVLNSAGTSTMDVLLVAVKNEIIRSYIAALEAAGLEPAIADVDYFALENMFALNYPEELNKVIAMVNVGARYSGVCILQDGRSLFSGDVGVGGRLYTDALCETLGMQPAEAEQAKMGASIDGYDASLVNETIDRTTEHIAGELHRQLGFFWNAAATDRGIEAIYLAGGSAQAQGLIEELGARTGMVCNLLEPLRAVDWTANFDSEYIDEIQLSMGVSVGLALRRRGDKTHAMN